MFPLRDSLPRQFFPWMVWTLITVNGLVFLLEVSLPPQWQQTFIYHFALVPARYTDPAWAIEHGLAPHNYLPFLSSQFLHGGWLHLILNMWTLWIFGPALEDRMGPLRFLVFYLLCGVVAGLFQFWFFPTSTIPTLGASGAIAGVIGAYAMRFPHARIIVMVPVLFFPFFFEIPALLFAGVWYLTQVLQGTNALLAPHLGGGVAWFAHIGGFLAGMGLYRFFLAPERDRPWFPDQGVLGFAPDGSPTSRKR